MLIDPQDLELAINIFGREIVDFVVSTVSLSDADGAYTLLEDAGMFEHAECVELLFFGK
jgi:hypothetical protein